MLTLITKKCEIIYKSMLTIQPTKIFSDMLEIIAHLTPNQNISKQFSVYSVNDTVTLLD